VGVGLAGAGAALVVRRLVLRRHRPLLDARPGLGADGIVAGGGAIDLPAPAGAPPHRRGHAALLLHGFGDTPQSMAYLAGYLNGLGYAVRAPLLPGHGRTLRAFTVSTADHWLAHARRELAHVRRRAERLVVVGQSMGGALAAVLAAEAANGPDGAPDALVLLAPYLAMPAHVHHLARTHRLWAPLLPLLPSRGEGSILDDAERAASLSLGVVSGPLLAELRRVVARATAALPRLAMPVLVVQSRRDSRIAPEACERAVARIGSRRKHLVWVDEGGHVLAVDRGRDRLFALAAEWLDHEFARAAPPAGRPRLKVRRPGV
jgi:carboxylesterase